MAKPKPAIQLRFPATGSTVLKVSLVERQADDSFKELDSFETDVAEFPENIQNAAMIHGFGDILGKRVSTVSGGREKFQTVTEHLIPKLAEGIWADGRGATIEQRAIASILRLKKLQDAKDLERKEPEKWRKALEHPRVQEEIERLKTAEKGGELSLDDLL